MHHLFDFGISQEDPLTEYRLLDIRPEDHLLCIASGGEVPLTLLGLVPGVRITAVDICFSQLVLCRLKMQAAISLPFPLNGAFLGYAPAPKKRRRALYHGIIKPLLSTTDQRFWELHPEAIEGGVVNMGRFERYIKSFGWLARSLIGRRNIDRLLACTTVGEQEEVFDRYIATRKSVRYLFRIAFHPRVYKNRGLDAQGLIHATSATGEVFFQKFRDFCTATPAARNWFFHYFIAGGCRSEEAYPEYLAEAHRTVLSRHHQNISWKHISLQDELELNPRGTFTRLHLSNIGDWMSDKAFARFASLLYHQCAGNEKMLYRYLQKNHLEDPSFCRQRFACTPHPVEKRDRFPFYSVLSIQDYGVL